MTTPQLPWQQALRPLVRGEQPPWSITEALLDGVLCHGVTDEEAPLAAWLVLNAALGEPPELLAAAASRLRERVPPAPAFVANWACVDTCGTGGDDAGLFNVSTAAALIVAACDVPVAKHGNRSVSSCSGSADVLDALGLPVALSPELHERSLREVGLTFLYAPSFHGALRALAPLRRVLGVRTLFNQLGPLLHPWGVRRQLIGAYSVERAGALAEAARQLGTERTWVVCSAGLDEINPFALTDVFDVQDNRVTRFQLSPSDFGQQAGDIRRLVPRCSGPKNSAAILLDLWQGGGGPALALASANAAAALVVSGTVSDLGAARQKVNAALAGGAVAARLAAWRQVAF